MSITGFCFSGVIRVGSNGATPGNPELKVGKATGTPATGRKTWDSNLQNGLDSTWVAVSFTAKSGGGINGVNLTVGGSTVVFSGASYGAITQLTFVANVDGAGKRFSFRNVVVDFYENDTDVDPAETVEVSDASAPIASTMGASEPAADSASLDVKPSDTYSKMVVSAEVRLESTDTGLPSSDSIAGTIYVFTASCS